MLCSTFNYGNTSLLLFFFRAPGRKATHWDCDYFAVDWPFSFVAKLMNKLNYKLMN